MCTYLNVQKGCSMLVVWFINICLYLKYCVIYDMLSVFANNLTTYLKVIEHFLKLEIRMILHTQNEVTLWNDLSNWDFAARQILPDTKPYLKLHAVNIIVCFCYQHLNALNEPVSCSMMIARKFLFYI
jgi:hypothetical protein